MYVVLFDVFLLLRKTDVLKTCPLALKSKKVEDIFGNTFIFSFVYKTVSQISFKLFFSGDKGFYQISLGNEVGFRAIMSVSKN